MIKNRTEKFRIKQKEYSAITAQIFRVPPNISGTRKAINFKFCTHIVSIDRNKSPLQISGKVAGWVVRTLETFQCTHILGASRGLLCDSSAVLYWIADESKAMTWNQQQHQQQKHQFITSSLVDVCRLVELWESEGDLHARRQPAELITKHASASRSQMFVLGERNDDVYGRDWDLPTYWCYSLPAF